MLCVGFLFLITTANSYGVLRQELNAPYTLTGTVAGQADLEKYLEIPSLEAVTPVLSFESKLAAKGASMSGMVTAVLADYLELSFTYGNPFPNDSNMPFLVLNQYAAQNFLDENKKKSTLSINDTLSMTIEGEEETAIVCGIFEDGLDGGFQKGKVLVCCCAWGKQRTWRMVPKHSRSLGYLFLTMKRSLNVGS